MTGLFSRISSLLQGSFAEETYNFKEPTNRSHPIAAQTIASSILTWLVPGIFWVCPSKMQLQSVDICGTSF